MTDVAVVGSGPNGLAAAVTLARAGLAVTVHEANETIGGGARTLELTEPGYRHDLCSAVHPMALSSPFFRAFELRKRVDYLTPDTSYAQVLAPGLSAYAHRDIDRTAAELGADGPAWKRLLEPLARDVARLTDVTLNSMLLSYRDPGLMLRLGPRVLEQAGPWGDARFRSDAPRALLAGVAAHGIVRLPSLGGAAVGLALAAHAHAADGWPLPRGGASTVIDALRDDLIAHGGTIVTGSRIRARNELGRADVIFDTSAHDMVSILGAELPSSYRRAIGRFRNGNGAAKVDYALSGPVPWADPALASVPTVHLGGSTRATREAENTVARGRHPEVPYVLITQPSAIDPSRAPAGGHVLWAYAHVPAGSSVDMTEAITARIEEMAPGFRDLIVGVAGGSALTTQAHNANYIGGDISGGAANIWQLVARPVLSPQPWRVPARGAYIASASAVPGPGIHGMGGFLAARTLLADRGQDVPALGLDA